MARPPARRASGDRTWQSILDGLTVRAKRDGLLTLYLLFFAPILLNIPTVVAFGIMDSLHD